MSSANATTRRERVKSGIYVRKDARGRKVYEIAYRDASGRQRWQTVEGGLRAAEAALADVKARLGRGERIIRQPNLTFAVAAQQWWDAQASVLRPATQNAYGANLNGYLLPSWGRRRLDEIDVNSVAALVRDMQKQGRKAWTIRGALVVAGRVFDYASRRLSWGGQNPVRLLDHSERPRSDQRARRILSRDEIAALLLAAEPRYQLPLALAVSTGIRLGELLGLIWDDVDFIEGHLVVRAQLDRQRQRVEPKTKRAVRVIELPSAIRSALEAERLASPFSASSHFVFCADNGQPWDHRNLAGRVLSRTVKRAGLDVEGKPSVTFHWLRHSFASAWIGSGGDLVELSAHLGHRDPSVTASVYAHEWEKASRSDARRSRIEAMLSGSGMEALALMGAHNGSERVIEAEATELALGSRGGA
jgi:integrase